MSQLNVFEQVISDARAAKTSQTMKKRTLKVHRL